MNELRPGIAAIALLAGLLTGCAEPRRGYLVRVPPPPPRAVGVVGYAPGPGYVWIDGHWDWRGRSWYWAPGRWALPPRPNATWVPGRWTPQRGGHRWRPGHWR